MRRRGFGTIWEEDTVRRPIRGTRCMQRVVALLRSMVVEFTLHAVNCARL